MRSLIVLVCIVFAASSAQQNYDGRNGPHEFGQPGNGIYIRGQNEGPYQVPGVGGNFQNSPSGGHVYMDEQGNIYSHHSSSTRSFSVGLAPSTVNLSMGGVLLVIISLIAL